jgi:hypothetical protein
LTQAKLRQAQSQHNTARTALNTSTPRTGLARRRVPYLIIHYRWDRGLVEGIQVSVMGTAEKQKRLCGQCGGRGEGRGRGRRERERDEQT